MKFTIGILLVIILGGGFWIYTQSSDLPDDITNQTGHSEPTEMEAEREDTTPAESTDEAATAPDENSNDEATVEVEADTTVETPAAEGDVETETAAEAEEESTTRTFDIVGTNFAFDQSELRVQEGDTVTINFSSDEGLHDWVLDEFDAATEQVGTDGTTSVTFVADEAGTYEYYCSVGQHRLQGMVGQLIVE